jgi:hypothetical protein
MPRMTPEEFDVYLNDMPEPTGVRWDETSEVMVLQWDDGSSKSVIVSRELVNKHLNKERV